VQIKKVNTYMKFINYIKECYAELVHKTSWPTRQELTNSAVVVLVASLLIALVVWLMDAGFENVMKYIYGIEDFRIIAVILGLLLIAVPSILLLNKSLGGRKNV
jgi:preprotein translocase subunit SecE